MSTPCSLGFFPFSDLSIGLRSPVSEYPCPLSFFLHFDSPCFPHRTLFRSCVPLEHFLIFGKQIWLSLACLPAYGLLSYVFSLSAFQHLHFSTSKAIFFKLRLLCAKVLSPFFQFYLRFSLRIHFQVSATPFGIRY